MPNLVQLRATQCGGKTTTVSQYLDRVGIAEIIDIPTSQGVAKATRTKSDVIVLGQYNGPKGGCDHYANRKMVYEAAVAAMDMQPRGGVVFEGLIYSNTCKLAEDLARAAEERGYEYHGVYLHRDFEDALAKVLQRNGGEANQRAHPVREGQGRSNQLREAARQGLQGQARQQR